MIKEKEFKNQLLKWSINNSRKYSWRNTKDPWKIYLIEIIAQQTQLDRADRYYKKFIKKFPNPTDMSKSTKREILEMWSGLGYNSRATRMFESSKILAKKPFDTIYPHFEILPGVGTYTNDALLSFAYGEKVITKDTNVLRIFSRFFGLDNPKNFILKNEKNILKNVQSRKFNQALMDFGAKVCTSKNPLCNQCMLEPNCKKFIKYKKQKQPAFKGSDREIRGKIIKYLIKNNTVDVSSLNQELEIEETRYKLIIKKLADEGMINIKNKKLIEIG